MIIKAILFFGAIWAGSLLFGFAKGFHQRWKMISEEKRSDELKGVFKWKQN